MEFLIDITALFFIAIGTIINMRGMVLSREQALRIASGSRDELTPAAIRNYILHLSRDSRIALPFMWVGIALAIIGVIDDYFNFY